MARGLFIDLDGTLADSGHIFRGIYDDFLSRHGAAGDDGDFASLVGPPLAEVVEALKKTHGLRDDAGDLLAAYRSLIAKSYQDVEPAAGAKALLKAARARNWVTGVVTSNNRDLTVGWLTRTGLRPLIDVVVAAEDITRGKPAPEPYLTALDRGACEAAASAAIEDSPQGARSAAAAGLRTFVLAKTRSPGNDWPPQAVVVSRLSDIMAHIFND